MRVADQPFPPVTLDTVPTLEHWPIRPVIALEQSAGEWVDATCVFTGLEIDTGDPDDAALFPAVRCLVQLDNRDGMWSGYNADGTLARFGPGTRCQVFATSNAVTQRLYGDLTFGDDTFGGTDSRWWLFSGRISRWDQRADDTVEFEAFDVFSDLAQPIGTYTPGTNGQTPAVRLAAILTSAGESPLTRFAAGLVSLTAQATERSPLEEMQTVAVSDGGVLWGDADGVLVYSDRAWRAGRTDQDAVPVVSDNVCLADFVIWDAVLSTNDERLADRVVLENVAGLKATAGTAAGYTWADSDEQWTTQGEGDALAALRLNDQKPRRVALDTFDVYLLDPVQTGMWRAVDWRRLDRIRFVHDQAAVAGVLQLDFTAVIAALVHTITPEGGWVLNVATSRAVSFTTPELYDTAGVNYDEGKVYGY